MQIDGVEIRRVQGLEGRLEPGRSGPGFGELLAEKLAQANRSIQQADAESAKLLVGNGSLHGTMIALERADLSVRLVGQVRNKIIDAYQNLSRMQI